VTAASFPFSAIVGQEDLKLGLLLNVICPSIGGVLLRGDKGTAKSTAVRALRGLLPEIEVVDGCPYSCDPATTDPGCPAGPHRDLRVSRRPVPLVELPLGAGADRVTGSLDIARALKDGVPAFQPGLLAAAHRGILYVDEVNLLPDHLVDLLLDVAAMGINRVERDGISVSHRARFVLVGTMNPEEGELRPQLLDRFGIAVEVTSELAHETRAEVVRRRLAFETDPGSFAAQWDQAERELRRRLQEARCQLARVRLSQDMLKQIVSYCASYGVQGMRADIVMAKTACALAAWAGRDEVISEDVHTAARLSLQHRRRREPLGISSSAAEGPGAGPGGGSADEPPDPPRGGVPRSGMHGSDDAHGLGDEDRAHDGGSSRPDQGEVFEPIRLQVRGRGLGAHGRRSPARSGSGHAVDDAPAGAHGADLSLAATVRAAAPHQLARGRCGGPLLVQPEDLRRHVREGREGNLIVFVVDASGSMRSHRRMVAVKGAVVSLLLDAYRCRDRVCLITFAGRDARVVLPPTSAVERAVELLRELTVGGRTPLAAGLRCAGRLISRQHGVDPDRRPLVVLISDGQANCGGDDPLQEAIRAAAELRAQGVAGVVVDARGGYRSTAAGRVARALGAEHVLLQELRAAEIVRTVRSAVGALGPGGRVA
jgi:magnesium chelatase subunit D